ncbi:hypothetical protein EV421DRAFT_1267463 [Armillaria borealis]|uniref:Uncharacterized protein n=1 Tax=Armillaria borealis TaxID=47425 RepID=A0AA39J2H3_9AGAR|nr:hypothetical protein EV421DRAFT_1267463 [Armillaria borealis]
MTHTWKVPFTSRLRARDVNHDPRKSLQCLGPAGKITSWLLDACVPWALLYIQDAGSAYHEICRSLDWSTSSSRLWACRFLIICCTALACSAGGYHRMAITHFSAVPVLRIMAPSDDSLYKNALEGLVRSRGQDAFSAASTTKHKSAHTT